LASSLPLPFAPASREFESFAVFLDSRPKFLQGQLGVVRVRAGSVTLVTPSANNPASNTADFTCALAHGHLVIDGLELGSANSAAQIILARRMSARISRNGPMTRFMGRFCSEPSPVSFDENPCPPKFPQQPHGRPGIPGIRARANCSSAAQSAAGHANRILVGFDFRAQRAHARQCAVAIRGAEKWRNSLVPSARPASIAYRWETICSPGKSSPPVKCFAG